MPRGRKPNISTKKVHVSKITCTMCGETKNSKEFYQSFNPIHSTAKLPYCKKCLKDMCIDSNGNINIEKVKQMLKLIDRPFLYDIFKSSMEDEMDTIGAYMKNIAMQQYRDLGWSCSVFEPTHQNDIIDKKYNNIFQATDNIIFKWGEGYQPEEYRAFERKYEFLKNNYPEKTSMHTEALLKYIRYSVKEEIATASNDVGAAKSWGQLAKDAATAAKINPSQLSAADLQDGLSTFGQLSRAVEQAVDIIKILPKFKERPQDKIDFTLWCNINYIRDLKGLPLCDYKDIWKFFDDRVKEHQNRFEFLQNKEDLLEEGD